MCVSPVSSDAQNRCRRLIVVCAAERGWALDPPTIERYITALTPLLEDLDAELQRSVVINYHQEHPILAALSDHSHPDYAVGWEGWAVQTFAVLRRAGVEWSHDQALATEDLVQEALADLARALPSFRYQSRFSSWAFSVLVQSARRQIRFSNAQRRAGRPDSLQQLSDDQEPIEPIAYHEHTTTTRLLVAQIDAVLGEHRDDRLVRIFRLWALEDRTSAEIGALVQLHESRVRALLKQARTHLQAHPAIRAWAEASGILPVE